MVNPYRVIAAVAVVLLLGGCGLKGDLYLDDETAVDGEVPATSAPAKDRKLPAADADGSATGSP